jgi:soluble lytic murein transglycosylase-like protein
MYDQRRGAGCCSGFAIPPLVILVLGGLLGAMAARVPMPEVSADASGQAAPPLSAVFTPEVQYWRTSIGAWAASAQLDPNLVAVIMQIESCGNPFARSRAGALGLFQVMPYHFAAAEDPYSPDTNAARGLSYLRRALAASNNDVRLALAGYNGGIALISRGESTWPAETVRYAYWGTGIYTDASGGATQSARLDEWLTAGGESLCRSASQQLAITVQSP